MSRIQSPVDDVERLTFHSMPSKKKVSMVAGVRVGRVHVFVDAAGTVYSTQVKERCYYTLTSGLDETLTGCRVLGLLSKEAVAKHAASVIHARVKRERRYAAESFAESAKMLGVRLTVAQERAIGVAAAGD